MTRPSRVVLVAVLAALLACQCVTLRTAGAQGSREPLVRDLSAVCTGEAGWDPATGDCAAIVHVLRGRAERQGVSLARMVHAYSGRHTGREASPRPWVAHLRLDGEQPAEWPASASWTRYRQPWLVLVAHVRDVLAGNVDDPCDGEADHWGGPMDDHRAERAGWTRLDCGPTRNHFWHVARREGGAS